MGHKVRIALAPVLIVLCSVLTLWMAKLYCNNPSALRSDGVPGDIYPVWSPNGKQIAYISNRGGADEVFTMNVDGTNIQRVTSLSSISRESMSSLAWSPDGSALAFVVAYDDFQNRLHVSNIFVVDIGTGQAKHLTQGSWDIDPSWSPNGKHIAFTAVEDHSWEIDAIALDGTTSYRVTHNSFASINSRPIWLLNKQSIAFYSNITNSRLVIDTDGSHLRLFDPTMTLYSFYWSADNKYVESLENEIWISDGNGTRLQQLTHNDTNDAFPSWSPDGKQIVFASTRADRRWGIYIMDADGAKTHRITASDSPDAWCAALEN